MLPSTRILNVTATLMSVELECDMHARQRLKAREKQKTKRAIRTYAWSYTSWREQATATTRMTFFSTIGYYCNRINDAGRTHEQRTESLLLYGCRGASYWKNVPLDRPRSKGRQSQSPNRPMRREVPDNVGKGVARNLFGGLVLKAGTRRKENNLIFEKLRNFFEWDSTNKRWEIRRNSFQCSDINFWSIRTRFSSNFYVIFIH